MNRRLVILWTTILYFGLLGVSEAITINNYAIVDGTAYDVANADGIFDNLDQTGLSLSVRQFSSASPYLEDRALLEFDISSFSPGDTINSISFEFFVRSYTGSGSENVVISAYSGDGNLSLLDAQIVQVVVGSYNSTVGLGARSVAISTPFIQSLIGTSNYLGLRLQGDTYGVNTQIDSIEGAALSLREGFPAVPPHLIINYNVVPEPSTMLLLGVGLVGLVGATRRKLKD